VSSLYQNMLIGSIVQNFETKTLVSGVTENVEGQTVMTIIFEEKKEEINHVNSIHAN
jgi:hypothetical protein